MLVSEMEAVLKSLEQRVSRIEQILATLATKTDLHDHIRGVKVLVEDVRGDVRLVHERIDAEAAGLSRRMGDMDGMFRSLQWQMSGMAQQLVEVLRRLDSR